MSSYLLAGGGTAGHVNPLLAVADRLSATPNTGILVVGTADGLESRLVPERGYELVTVEKVTMPRRASWGLFRFPSRFLKAVREIRRLMVARDIDVVVGFGGFVSAPAYVAAWRERRPIVVHEANAVPGFANRLGSRFTRFVGVAIPGTRLRNARVVGMPMKAELETLDPLANRQAALRHFGFEDDARVILVTGGSLGARAINETVSASAATIREAGWSILHITGDRSDLAERDESGYHVIRYCDRMDLALSLARLAIARAGSATVSELTALGIPAVYVPLAIGNGEQRRNAASVVAAGGALLVDNERFSPEWISQELVPLLNDSNAIAEMSKRTAALSVRDGTARTVELVLEATASSTGGRRDQV